MSSLPTELLTSSLRLRAPVLADAQAIFDEYAADPEVTRYLTWEPHQAARTVAEFLEILISQRRSGEQFNWVLTLRGSDRAIGMLGARVSGHKVDIGYVLARKHWGKGYMTEAVSDVTERLLCQAEIFRVWAVCDVENVGSARILEKSKFEQEGILRRWVVLPNRSSEPRDCFVYGRAR